MYPRTRYICDGRDKADGSSTYRPVIISGYREAISLSGFKNVMETTAYNMQLKLKKDCFSYIYHVDRKEEIDHSNESHIRVLRLVNENSNNNFTIAGNRVIVGEPIGLYDYYEEIGWDRKTKKINGLTVRQHIKKHMEFDNG